MTDPNPAHPADPHDDNPKLKLEDFARMRPADEVLPPGAMATFKRTRGSQNAPTQT